MMKMDPGYGFCDTGYYDGWNASIANEADCNAKCLEEEECEFVALSDGYTCSRYNSGADGCTLNGDTNHVPYAKVPCTDVPPPTPVAPPPTPTLKAAPSTPRRHSTPRRARESEGRPFSRWRA